MPVTIKFTNRNADQEEGIRVWRSDSTFDKDSLPSDPIATLDPGSTEFEDTDVERGDVFYYLLESFNGDDSAFSELLETEALPIATGAGPQTLQAGDHIAGFYGEVTAADFITGDALASAINLTAGTSHNSDEPWLKFNHNGKTLFVAKKTLRYGIDWNDSRGHGEVTISGDIYQVRLLSGSNGNTVDGPDGGPGGEWNDLMYPIHTDDPNGQGWGINYTNSDLNMDDSNGSRTWSQEGNDDFSDTTQRLLRGRSDITDFYIFGGAESVSHNGWRPVLEYIGPAS